MEHKTIYYHNFKKANTLLAKFEGKGIISLSSDFSKEGNALLITFNTNNYTVFGGSLKNLSIYYDSSDSAYYIVKTTSTTIWGQIDEITRYQSYQGLKHGYGEAFTVSETMTQLYPTNQPVGGFPLKYIPYVSLAQQEVYNYTSVVCKGDYNSAVSLIMLSARQANGVALTYVFLLHRNNNNNDAEFTITNISNSGTLSNFPVTPTSSGFSVTNLTGSWRLSITEMGTVTNWS